MSEDPEILEPQTQQPEELAEVVELQEPADAADTLENLQEQKAADVLEEMDDTIAANVLAEMNLPLAVSIMDDLIDEEPAYAALLMEQMAPDDAADLLQGLDDERRRRLLSLMGKEEARELATLVQYEPQSAGGMMTTEYLSLRDDLNVAQAIEQIRILPVPEHQHYALVIDAAGKLVGLVGLRKLLLSRAGERLRDIMDREVDSIRATMDREAVAREFDRYGYEMMPVVDDAGRLLGIITVDDVIDIIRAEQTEDVQKQVGAGAGEMVYSTLGEKIRGRFPWLVVNLFTSMLAAIVVMQFDDLIGELAVLAVLMPVIANQAGNAGQQSLAVTLRGIVLDEVRAGRIGPLLLREAAVGITNGLVGGLLVGTVLVAVTGILEGANWRLGAVAAAAMAISLAAGCFVGAAMPLLMRRMKFDPATGSTIFLTMTTDTVSFLTFLGIASWCSEWVRGSVL